MGSCNDNRLARVLKRDADVVLVEDVVEALQTGELGDG